MKWIKKFIVYAILTILIIVIIVTQINNLREKQYDKIINFISTLLGCIVFNFIDLQYQKKIKAKVERNIILHGLLILTIYIFPCIATFFILVMSSDFYISNIFVGLIFPVAYFPARRFRIWLEDEEPSENSENKNDQL